MKKKKIFGFVLASFAVALLVGCGDDDSSSSSDDLKFGELPFAVKGESSALETKSDEIKGSGKVAFKDPIATSVDAEKHVELQFSLEDGGSLKLLAFANKDLEEGIDLLFTRSGQSLEGKILVADKETDITGQQGMADFDASQAINLKIDIHNSEDPAHVIMWQAEPSVEVSEETEKLNSADSEEGDVAAQGRGSGTFWGVELTNATVNHIELKDAQETDHEDHDHEGDEDHDKDEDHDHDDE